MKIIGVSHGVADALGESGVQPGSRLLQGAARTLALQPSVLAAGAGPIVYVTRVSVSYIPVL